MFFLAVVCVRAKPKEDPVIFPPELEVIIYERPYNHEEDIRFPEGPEFLELISIKEPRESSLAFSYDEDGSDFFKMFLPESSVQEFEEKHYVVISPTEFESPFKRREHFTAMSRTFQINMNPLDVINLFRRVLYGVPFSAYREYSDIVKARIETECVGSLYGEYGSADDVAELRTLALLWWEGNQHPMEEK